MRTTIQTKKQNDNTSSNPSTSSSHLDLRKNMYVYMLAAVWAKNRWTKLGLFVLQLFQLNLCCIGEAIAQPHLYNIYHTRSFPTRRYFSRSTLRFLRATNPGPKSNFAHIIIPNLAPQSLTPDMCSQL